jgi:hypothetical protein
MRTDRDVAVSYWDRDWPGIRRGLEWAAERTRGEYPNHAMNQLSSQIDRALLVHGSAWVREHYASLGTTLDAVVLASEQLGADLATPTIQKFARDLLGCEAAGIPIAPATHAWIVRQCAAQSQAWLQTFVGAIERKAPWAEVEPHWRSLLEVWPYHGSTVGCSTTAVFFSAFAMNVWVRGAPPETTGDFFREATVRADENALTL